MTPVNVPLNKPDIPGVFGPPPKDPDRVPAPPKSPPAPTTARPTNPNGEVDVIPPPRKVCGPGVGWDFEDLDPNESLPIATLQSWHGDGVAGSPFVGIHTVDLDQRAAPAYGNAAPIDRIRPPGWRPDIEGQIGGDYWKFSQTVNAHGDFWVTSRYRRYSWRQHPGDTWDEASTGTLTSPYCRLEANFLTFQMSGGQSTSQRVELQVRNGNTRDYFGIRFSASLGDRSPGSKFGHGTQFPRVPTVPQSFPPSAAGWVVLRSVTSQDQNESDWMQTYVFDVRRFRGKVVRIRIVDDSRSECARFQNGVCQQMAQEHVNADAFQFSNKAPDGTQWMWFDERQCGGVPGVPDECSPIGWVPSEPPLWGVTDAHAHPMANLGFGGHMIWGDVSDSLLDVYDCTRNLPAIPGPGGRDAITQPAESTACYLSGDIVAIVGATGMAACTLLDAVPFVGFGAASLCHGAIAAAEAVLLTTPMLEGLRLHGADKFASGALDMGLMFGKSWLWLEQFYATPKGNLSLDFEPGLMASFDAWSNAKPTLDWYRDPSANPPEKVDWHSFTGLGKSHNLYQADMIRRAFQGGMRLGVWDVVSSRALGLVADGSTYSDWRALKDETDAAKRIVSTSLNDIAEIAYDPAAAERIIRSGRMAVILGTEVDELGRARPDGMAWPRSPHTSPDSMQKQIDDLWELGIRKITPVHSSNNPIGGAAIFTEKYASANHFLNATPEDQDPDFFDLAPVRFILDRSPWMPFDLILGDFQIFRDIAGDGVQPWNPHGWFDLDTRAPANDGIVNGVEQITYRLGIGKPKGSDGSDRKSLKDNLKWLPPQEVLGKQILIPTTIGDMATFIRPIGQCNLINTVKPRYANSFGADVDTQYVKADGHRNALGLFRAGGNDGETFLRAAMKRGMILDVDHMSQNMRIDAYKLAADYASEARAAMPDPCAGANVKCGDYPFMGVHTTVRELEKEGSGLDDFRSAFGANDESTRTPSEIEHVVENGGAIGVFPRGSAFIPPNTAQQDVHGNVTGGRCNRNQDCLSWQPDGVSVTWPACNAVSHTCTLPDTYKPGVVFRNWELPQEVANDCDTSSKTFAVKYLWLMKKAKGRGLTLTTDLNGLIGGPNPRFGGATPGKDVCGGNKRDVLDPPGDQLYPPPGSPPATLFSWGVIGPEMQKQEHSGVWYADYNAKSSDSDRAKAWTDTLPHKRWRQAVARSNSEVREDFAPRYRIDENVYFNDHGPELPIRKWSDQNGNEPGAQMFPMKRWRNWQSGWDFNLDGLQHIGLLPDLIQDMRNVGVQWEQLGPLFRGAREYVDMWKRSVSLGLAHP